MVEKDYSSCWNDTEWLQLLLYGKNTAYSGWTKWLHLPRWTGDGYSCCCMDRIITAPAGFTENDYSSCWMERTVTAPIGWDREWMQVLLDGTENECRSSWMDRIVAAPAVVDPGVGSGAREPCPPWPVKNSQRRLPPCMMTYISYFLALSEVSGSATVLLDGKNCYSSYWMQIEWLQLLLDLLRMTMTPARWTEWIAAPARWTEWITAPARWTEWIEAPTGWTE